MMMTPQAAASLLLSITQQEPPRVNLSFPLNGVSLPTAADLDYRRDRYRIRYRIQSILQDGLMPKVNWQKVKVEVIFELTRLLHHKVRAHFDSAS
jgi:hypothetical protein